MSISAVQYPPATSQYGQLGLPSESAVRKNETASSAGQDTIIAAGVIGGIAVPALIGAAVWAAARNNRTETTVTHTAGGASPAASEGPVTQPALPGQTPAHSIAKAPGSENSAPPGVQPATPQPAASRFAGQQPTGAAAGSRSASTAAPQRTPPANTAPPASPSPVPPSQGQEVPATGGVRDGVYVERQTGNYCGLHTLRSILYSLGIDTQYMPTATEYRNQVKNGLIDQTGEARRAGAGADMLRTQLGSRPDGTSISEAASQQASVNDICASIRLRGFQAEEGSSFQSLPASPDSAERRNLSNLRAARALALVVPGGTADTNHWIALVRDPRGQWRIADSRRPNARDIVPGTNGLDVYQNFRNHVARPMAMVIVR